MILLNQIRVKRGSRTLLDLPQLRLLGGQTTVVLGPNGAGKSTLLKVLSGSLKPDHGEVHLFGKKLPEWNSKRLAQSRAMLSQHYSMPFAMTVRELVAMGRFPHRKTSRDEKMIDEAMEEMHIHRFAARSVPTLSGGEQQRAHMARVLLQLRSDDKDAARLLLLDEPISSLDIVHQQTLLNKAKEAAGRGYTVIMVLHDINQAMAYADNYILLKNGSLAAHTSTLSSEMLGEVFDIPMLKIEDTQNSKHYFFASSIH